MWLLYLTEHHIKTKRCVEVAKLGRWLLLATKLKTTCIPINCNVDVLYTTYHIGLCITYASVPRHWTTLLIWKRTSRGEGRREQSCLCTERNNCAECENTHKWQLFSAAYSYVGTVHVFLDISWIPHWLTLHWFLHLFNKWGPGWGAQTEWRGLELRQYSLAIWFHLSWFWHLNRMPLKLSH